jgi:hypothetical protein
MAEVINGLHRSVDDNAWTLSIDGISGTASVEINVRTGEVKGLVERVSIPILGARRLQDHPQGFAAWCRDRNKLLATDGHLIVAVPTREGLPTVPVASIEAANGKANPEICSMFAEVLAGLAYHGVRIRGVATDGDNACFPLYKPTFDLVVVPSNFDMASPLSVQPQICQALGGYLAFLDGPRQAKCMRYRFCKKGVMVSRMFFSLI